MGKNHHLFFAVVVIRNLVLAKTRSYSGVVDVIIIDCYDCIIICR